MSSFQLIFNFDGWKKAFKQAVRVFSYTAAFYIVISVMTLIPTSLFSQNTNLILFFTVTNVLLTLFAFILSFFKVLDEDKTKATIALSQNSIKLV